MSKEKETSNQNVEQKLIHACKDSGLAIIRARILELDFTLDELQERTGISQSYLSYFKSGQRNSIPTESIEPILVNFMPSTSAEEIFFGTNLALRLPRYMCEMVTCMQHMTSQQKHDLYQLVNETYKDVLANYNVVTADRKTLAYSRFIEYADSIGPSSPRLLGELASNAESPPYTEYIFPKSVANYQKAVRGGFSVYSRGRVPISGMLMTMACSRALDVPLDYMLCIDYTTRVDMMYFDTRAKIAGPWQHVTDTTEQSIIQIYLKLPKEQQASLFAMIENFGL